MDEKQLALVLTEYMRQALLDENQTYDFSNEDPETYGPQMAAEFFAIKEAIKA